MSAYVGDRGHAGRASETPARLRGRLIAGSVAAVAVAVAALLLVRLTAVSPVTPPRSERAALSQLQRLPLPLRARLSSAQGARSWAYRVRAGSDGSLQARGGGIVSSFSRGWVSLRGARGRASLALVGMSDAGAAVPIAQAPPRASENRVDYAHGAVSEWYANGPHGLEQGFTVASGRPGGLTIALADRGGRPRLRGGSIELAPGLRYGGLVATDAAGRRLPSRLAVSGGRILLEVNAAGARFPVRVDPFVYEEMLSYAAHPDLEEAPGGVALSADGDTAVVGASQPAPGAVYVFQRGSNGVWALQQTISPGGKDGYFFGSHVALSEEGRTLLVTAGTSSDIGQIWTYTLKEGVWSPDAETITDPIKTPAYGTDKPGYEFGNAVALDGIGGLALVADEPQDAAIVYQRAGAEWHQLSILSDHSEDEYGIAIALSGSGNEALVAAPGGELVYSYSESADTWKESGQFKYFNFDGQHNVAVAISREGNTAISGEYFPARARVWVRNGSEWEQQALLTEPAGPGEEEFGSDVSLSASGSKALILAFGGEGVVAYEYTRTGSTWIQQDGYPTMSYESLGHSVGYIPEVVLSGEGHTALLWSKFTSAPELYTDTPALSTGAPGELKTTSVTLKGTVNPAGETPTSCRFEYGTSTAYGSVKACSPLPEGLEPVAVSGALSGLSAGKTYHFRLQVVSPAGTFYSSDATFTTVTALATAKTEEPSKPATATLGSVSATASDGTGTIAVGSYGTNVGEPPLPSSTGGYLDVYRSTTASFAQVEIKTCEIGNAKALWAYGNEGWEPVSPAATLTGGCLVFTATPTSRPSVSELEGFRYKMGEPAGQFGECRKAKDSVYTEGACMSVHESKGHADGKGKYEWYPTEAGVCFAQKKGEFEEGACKQVEEKKGKPDGKYELANGTFTSVIGRTVLEVGSEKIECSGGAGAGELTSPEKGRETITLEGCAQKATSCSSAGAAADTIVSFPLEVIVLQGTEAGKFELALAAAQFASFSCGAASYAIEGAAAGPLTGAVIDNMGSTSQASFTSAGSQLIDLSGSTETAATLSTSLTTTSAQPLELNTALQP